jgi:subtilisin family serine protease
VDQYGALAGFSSRGPTSDNRIKPDLCARGVSDALVAAANTGYTAASGTSFSCPLLAGLAACLMQAQPSWPATAIIRALRFTASKATSPDNLMGYGIPNGGSALQWIRDTASVPGRPPFSVGLRLAGANPLTPTAGAARVLFGVGVGAGVPRLRVLDAQGRIVVDRLQYTASPAGPGERFAGSATWDGRDDGGRTVRPGVYFITLEAGVQRATVRVVSLR